MHVAYTMNGLLLNKKLVLMIITMLRIIDTRNVLLLKAEPYYRISSIAQYYITTGKAQSKLQVLSFNAKGEEM